MTYLFIYIYFILLLLHFCVRMLWLLFLFSVFLTVYIYLKDSSKNKTREELLAEERDYKRRRMSYHGKKVKRSTTQVREITFTLNFRLPFFF